jgi:hypothetical protein
VTEPVRRERLDGVANEPVLAIESGPGGVGWCITARNLGPDLVTSLGRHAGSLLRVKVARAGYRDDDLPDISGDYDILRDSVRFIPHFPFDFGILFRAILDLRALGRSGRAEVRTLEFSFPRVTRAVATKVKHVFPSGDVLPTNLLRFYICFSNPMQRGRATNNIEILHLDGSPALDVLYRAPIELWDSSMTCLTVLLDPGRLKRGVGPNRALGSPLRAGQRYTLAIGRGMIDAYGRPLCEAFHKSFSVSEAIREPIAIEEWKISSPAATSHESLEITFPRPLDWAQLSRGIAVAWETGQPIDGRFDVSAGETRWRFTPDEPWQAGAHCVRVAPGLEDICGNTPSGAFDGPFRSADQVALETTLRIIPFAVNIRTDMAVPAAEKRILTFAGHAGRAARLQIH